MAVSPAGPSGPGGPLRAAFSPCPNDTFVFHAWVHGLLPGAPRLEVRYADVDVTNGWAERADGDLLKISYAALPWALRAGYALLPSGGALGRGCGPLVLARDAGLDLAGCSVAIPAERSTAYLLFRLWLAGTPVEVRVLPFAQIMPAVRDGVVAAGLVIHEARFTYPAYGLSALVDLGQWWEEDTGLPIPLGAIVARPDRDPAALGRWVRASVEQAWDHPERSAAYVAAHAAELDPAVQAAHIALYVTEFTRDLGAEGEAAVAALLHRAAGTGLVPEVAPAALRPAR